MVSRGFENLGGPMDQAKGENPVLENNMTLKGKAVSDGSTGFVISEGLLQNFDRK